MQLAAIDRLLFRRTSHEIDALGLALVCGGLTFWLTGAALKVVFMVFGKASLPWSAFIGPESLAWGFLLAAFLSLPHFVLLVFGRRYVAASPDHASAKNRETVIIFALRGGTAATILQALAVFWAFDPIVFFLGLPFFLILPSLGIGAGLLVGRSAS